MKVGLGIPAPLLSGETLRSARQIGATHIVAHFASEHGSRLDVEGFSGVEYSREGDSRFRYEHFARTAEEAAAAGLTVAAVENFTAADWSDVLPDGTRREAQIERLRTIIKGLIAVEGVVGV